MPSFFRFGMTTWSQTSLLSPTTPTLTVVPESAELLFPHAVRPPTSDVTANTAAAILLIFMSLRSPGIVFGLCRVFGC